MTDVNNSEYLQVENKLILLYLINKMDLPLSRSQLTDFVREGEYMDYYTLQQTLAEMVDGAYLEKLQDNNNTRYSITDEGVTTLEYFESHITKPVRQMIDIYIEENRGKIKKDYESIANYFPNVENDEFKVKCGVYEDKRAIIELFVSVETREQAKLIQANWRANASGLYTKIIEALTEEQEQQGGEESVGT